MNKIQYEVTKTLKEERVQEIESKEFICVEHRIAGITYWTAFIGKGESDNSKKSITISRSGGVFEVYLMAGSALLNARSLLKKDKFNKIIQNELFIKMYNEEKERLVIDDLQKILKSVEV